jgi:hypothetical protein
MKKKVFSLMMTLLLAFVGVVKADVVEIGNGTGTTYYFPIDNYFNYSCTEQIYLASEIGTAGTINSISFYYNYGTAYTANNVTMYMKNVSRTEFASTSDYEPLSAADIVWTGAIAPTAAGWYTFTLDTPFEYNGTDNLLVAFYDGTSGYPGTSYTWRQTTSPESAYMALRYYSDSSNPDPYNLGSYSGSKTWYTYRANVQIDITPGGAGAPYEVQIGDGTSTSGYFPFYTLYNYSLSENLFLASELTDAGVLPGQVTSLSWYATNSTGYEQSNISIWMANSQGNSLSGTSTLTSGMTLVYTGAMTPQVGWNEFECNAGTFTWDGTSNILIIVQRNNGDWNSTVNWQYTTTSFTSNAYVYNDDDAYDAVTTQYSMSTNSNRANIIIKGVSAGSGPDYEVVNTIEIEGFEAPAWGVTPEDHTYVPEDANYTLVESGWSYYYPSRGETREQGRLIEPDPNFTELDDRAYYMYFYIEANEGYGFTSSTEPLLNGEPNMFHEDSSIGETDAYLYTIDFFPGDAYEEGLHTYAMYGVGENATEYIDRLLIERPNGAWMEPYHFQLYNDGEEDVDVVVIDFLHNNGYFSMAEGTEYPFTVAANGLPGVDLYINTNYDWADTEEINSLLAVNTTERSTHLYAIIAAPYEPFCPDVWEKAYNIGTINGEGNWSMWTDEMWNEVNPNEPYELHDNYTLPFSEIPEGYDAVMKFTLTHDMMLNAYVSDGDCGRDELNGKVALYRSDFNGEGGPMADNYYDGRPFHNDGGSTPSAYTSIDFETGNFTQFSNYTNDATYPWFIAAEAAHGGSYGMMSGNAGVASSSSTFTATVNYAADGMVSFDYNACGEGSSTAWDKCIFKIDGTEQFRYGAVQAWNNFSANVAAGQHIFTWIYEKDSSVNPTGDYFAVDNIVFDGGRIMGEADRELVSIDDGGYNAVAIPCNFIWQYNENQMILTADEIGMNGSITSVAYKRYSEGSGSPATRNLDIYMVHTSMDSYASTADWIPVTPADLVFSGEYTFETTGTDWQTITLDTPFEYNGTDNLCICIDDNTGTTTSRIYWSAHYTTPSNRSMRAWSSDNNFDPTQAGTPVGGTSLTGNWAADIQLNIDDQLVPIDPDHEHAYTAGPVIEGLNVLAGTYYLVASSTCENFEVTIDFDELPCPIEAVTGIYPEDNASDVPSTNLTLHWTLNDYCNEWRIIFGSTYYPEDEPNHPATYISEWSSDLAESLRITDYVQLWNNTNYFWRIEQRSNPGTQWECKTSGPVFGFTTSLNSPTNLQASNTRIFEYEESVTLTWTPIQDRTYRRYRIYMDGEMIHQTPNNQVVTSYTIPQDLLTYNMYNEEGYIFEVTAVYDEGESPVSNPVEIWVSGNGTVSGYVYEQDETTPIGGVTVTITGTNEFGQTETYTYTTDNNGYYHGNIHAGIYGYAVATMEGYQNAETTHEMPLDIVYDEETDHVDFIMDELFIAPAHVCAQTTYVQGVQGDSLVHVWWDFNFFTTLTENFEDWANTPYAWQNDATYPWTLTTEAHEGTYAFKSGNAGVHSSTSTLEVTVDIPQDGQFSFDLWARGESTTDTYDWDVCRFFFDGQQMFQYGQHSGWETYSMPITAGSHTFRWVYKKDSSVHPSAGDCFIIDNIVFVGHADRADRSLHHYNIYRTDCYNDGPYNSDNTTFLSTVWRPDTSYMDVQWPEVPVGVYKWGVSAVYSGNYEGNPNNPRIDYPFEERESEIVWSDLCGPCIDKDMYLENEVSVNVVLNSADSPEGVQVDFFNTNPGEQFNHPQAGVTLDQTGYYLFPRFRKGDYIVTVSLPGYETIQVPESIWEPRDLRYVLIEIICKVQNLYVSRTGWAMWDPQEPCPGGAVPTPTPGGYSSLSQGFEEGFGDWTTIDANNDGYNWMLGTTYYSSGPVCHTGSNMVCSQSYDYLTYAGITPDNYLVSPQVTLGGTFSFWACAQDNAYPAEKFGVAVSTSGNTNAADFTTIQSWTMTAKGMGAATNDTRSGNRTQGNWYQYTVDLSDYAGQTGYVAIRHYGCYDQFLLNVDDIEMNAGRAATAERHLEGYKVMCTSIDGEPIFNHNTPADQPFCQLATDQLVEGNQYKCKVAAIYSTGMSEYEEVTWQYESCENYAGTVNGLTAEGSTISWDYPGGGVTPGPGGDATTFTEGFEGGLPTGWTTIDGNNDGYTWTATSAIPTTWTYYASLTLDWYHNGTDAMCSGSYINGVGAITPDEYLVSPQVTLAAGSQLSFWVAATDASYPADHFGVFISDNGTSGWTSVQEWTLTAKSGGFGSSDARVRSTVGRDNRATRLGTWYNYTVDLSAYAGEKYIAFRHFNCNDQYIMCLDDVELTTGAKSDRNPWDLIANLSMTSSGQQAIATDGEFIYTGSWQSGTPTGGSRFHQYTLDGTHVEGFEISGMNSVQLRDFTFDGQYFYCGASSSTLYCIDLANQTLVGQTTTGCSAIRHCSYDPERDGFWMGDWSTLALYSRTGALVQSAPAPSSAYGSAYYKDANDVEHLYLFCQPSSNCEVYDYNITTNTLSSAPIFSISNTNAQCTGIAGGAFIGEYNGMTAFFANCQQDPNLVAIYELAAAPTPTPTPTPAEGILGAMIFVDGEWEAFVEYPTNSYTYEGDGQEICVRMVYDGTAETPANNFYYAMSCEECVGGLEPTCEPGAPIYGEVTANDQVRVYWSAPVPPTPEEGDTFEYNFDNSSIEGLTLIDNDGDGNNWMLGSVAMTTGYGHNGSNDMILSKSYDNNTGALTPDNYIVFPQSNVVNGSTFSFYACGQDASWASEHFGVAVSTTGNTSAADFTTIAEWTMTAKGTKAVRDGRDQGNWYEYTVDLSDYAGMPVYIAIRHFNCTDMFYLDVDDVTLSNPAKGNRDGIIGYNIYRSTDNVDYALVGNVPGTATEYFDNPGEGTFYYQVTAVYANCESEPAVSGENPAVNYVMVGRTGIGENSTEVNLFPNPTKGNVTIQAMNMHRITVVSVLGQVVFDTELEQDEYILNMSKFNTGMYMVRVYTDEGVTVKRVTVLH